MARITETQWIEHFGFQRFPFDRPEAGNEEFARPDFLAACFVEPACFERVLGQADAPVTTLLFASRGSGKTACRVMVDYYCQRGQVNRERLSGASSAYVLSIPHIHLHQIFREARQGGFTSPASIHLEHHVDEILRRAIPAFTDLIAKTPDLEPSLATLSATARYDLNWLIAQFSDYLSTIQITFLNRMGLGAFAGTQANDDDDTHVDTKAANGGAEDAQLQMVLRKRANLSSVDHLVRWAELMNRAGISATYVLVDGVDELVETAADPQACLALLKPLMASLRLMDGTPHLALKFFLPQGMWSLIQADASIRKDRGFVVETIRWSEDDLIEILRRRLDALRADSASSRDRTPMSLDVLCTPDLRGRIEQELAGWVDGNPRHLMLLCGLIVSIHCAKDEVADLDDPYLLTRADVQAAQEQFDLRIRPAVAAAVVPHNQPLSQLIAQAENEQIEFKSSFRWDYKTNTQNKVLQQVVAKTLAAMMNAEGGVLLIGVADNGAILGIEPDLKGLSKPNTDGFQLLLSDVVKTSLGVEHLKRLHVRFEEAEDKTVCVVGVEKSLRPVYLVGAGEAHEFWVRFGNSTRVLDVKAAMSYIQEHWSQHHDVG